MISPCSVGWGRSGVEGLTLCIEQFDGEADFADVFEDVVMHLVAERVKGFELGDR